MTFYKYHGAGNDFILIDQREDVWVRPDQQTLIATLCDRHFGIGADGLILLEKKPGYDFEMVYFNSDGRPSSMCGNGGRCIVAFARHLGIIETSCSFLAVDGPHEAVVVRPDWIELKMSDVASVEIGEGFYYLDTGSPHYVQFVPDLSKVDVVVEGRAIRYNDRFKEVGTNVNFVQPLEKGIQLNTYERGVEGETLACGTGVTAAAIASFLQEASNEKIMEIPVQAKGGNLAVRFKHTSEGFKDIWLCGPAKLVFSGKIDLP